MDTPVTPSRNTVSSSPSPTPLLWRSSSTPPLPDDCYNCVPAPVHRHLLPPPLPWLIPNPCSDSLHCGRDRAHPCDSTTMVTCPGLGNNLGPTPTSLIGDMEHPGGPESVVTCGQCRTHVTDFEQRTIGSITTDANTNPRSGYRIQLCRTCIRDEVELYWLRQGTVPDPALVRDSTLALVKSWPLRNGIQDLCICEESFVEFARTNCHSCRLTAFNNGTVARRDVAEEILRHLNKAVITGKRPHRLNDDINAPENRISNAMVDRRVANGIGRMCPCGEKPKQQSTPEYITFCMGCSGVRIDPHYLPADLQEQLILASYRRRQTLRNPDRNTKGPAMAKKNPLYRVNTECGWMGPDPWLNGK